MKLKDAMFSLFTFACILIQSVHVFLEPCIIFAKIYSLLFYSINAILAEIIFAMQRFVSYRAAS